LLGLGVELVPTIQVDEHRLGGRAEGRAQAVLGHLVVTHAHHAGSRPAGTVDHARLQGRVDLGARQNHRLRPQGFDDAKVGGRATDLAARQVAGRAERLLGEEVVALVAHRHHRHQLELVLLLIERIDGIPYTAAAPQCRIHRHGVDGECERAVAGVEHRMGVEHVEGAAAHRLELLEDRHHLGPGDSDADAPIAERLDVGEVALEHGERGLLRAVEAGEQAQVGRVGGHAGTRHHRGGNELAGQAGKTGCGQAKGSHLSPLARLRKWTGARERSGAPPPDRRKHNVGAVVRRDEIGCTKVQRLGPRGNTHSRQVKSW